ncbi:glycosyltransferase family 2 protein [uncultured Bacteroides sp.]|uniref:glycosyltransferase family 2 protein n=1 Tax=uncultured Bacteroides sp. TaxID=162156 RepID=UPI002AAC145A|nr:glycosyltransferase family 2 protein [uncultured Bacteroides sp.]
MSFQVSIIIPVYNVEKYMKRCVLSLFEQTLNSIEYIFVNDYSTDASMHILYQLLIKNSSRAACVKIVNHKTNRGSAAARNTGLNHARGKYIGWVDADDWVEPDMFEQLYKAAEANHSDIVWCDFYYSYVKYEKLMRQKDRLDPMVCIKHFLAEKRHAALWNKLVKRSLYVKNNISFLDGLNIWEDLRVIVQLFFYARKITYIPEAYYHYAQYNMNSISVSAATPKITEILGNAESLILFLKEKEIPGIDRYLNHLKLAAKQTLLFATDRHSFIQWRRLYAESNRYIWSYSALPLHLRFIGWCTSLGIWPIIDFWIYLKRKRGNNGL